MSKRVIPSEQAKGFPPFSARLPKAAESALRSGGRSESRGRRLDPDRDAAFKEGFAAGYEGGFQQGHKDALELERLRLEAFSADLRALVSRVEGAMDLWFQKAEHGLSQLSTDIARRIVADELQSRPEAIVAIVREALGRVTDSLQARIRVNPFDIPALAEREAELIAASQAVHQIEIVGDDSLSRGSTVIECGSGVVDARVESKLDLLIAEEAA